MSMKPPQISYKRNNSVKSQEQRKIESLQTGDWIYFQMDQISECPYEQKASELQDLLDGLCNVIRTGEAAASAMVESRMDCAAQKVVCVDTACSAAAETTTCDLVPCAARAKGERPGHAAHGDGHREAGAEAGDPAAAR